MNQTMVVEFRAALQGLLASCPSHLVNFSELMELLFVNNIRLHSQS
jgi:hypothetical protein